MNQQLCELLGINYPIFQGGMALGAGGFFIKD